MPEDKKELVQQIKQASFKIPPTENLKMIPSGSSLLDCALGGGYPVGKMINIVGDKSTGKTLLAMEAIVSARKQWGEKLKWFYDDVEAGFSFSPEQLYGFSIIQEQQENSASIESFENRLNKQLDKLKEDEFLVYVLDSFDALTSEAEMQRAEKRRKAIEEGKKVEGTYAMDKQKFASEFFRLQCKKIKDKNCLLIIVSQVRDNIGVMFGEKYRRSGGKSLDFYASQIIWLAVAEKKTKKDRVVGVTIKANIKKNKIAPPFRTCFVNMLFDYGIDDVSTCIDYLYDLRTDTGKSRTKKVVWTDTGSKDDEQEYTPVGLISHIEEKDLEESLRGSVVAKWQAIEDSISSKDRKRRF